MKGRKPKPTHLKLLAGNPGKRPMNAAELMPTGDLHDAPEWLSDDQRAGWAYAIANAPAGLLKRLDRSTLTAWVVAEDLHRQAVVAVGKSELITKSPNTNTPIQSPYLAIINRQAQIMLKAAAELGFTPASRGRVAVSESAKSNPFSTNGRRQA